MADAITDYVSTRRYKRMPDGTMVEDYGTGLMSPDFTTPGDIARAQKAATIEYGVNAGIGALGSAAQLGTSFIDTAQDTKNKSALSELESLEKRNKLGLTGEERSTYERGLLNPVKAAAAEQGRRTEARLAAGGKGSSAADIVRAQRESDRRLDEAGIQAAQKIEGANLQRKADQRAEMEQRRSYESGRETQRLNYVAEAIPGLLSNIGKAAAGIALPAQMTDAQLLQMQNAVDANGQLIYPAYEGKSLAEMRDVIEASAKANLWGTPKEKATMSAMKGGTAGGM